MATETHGSLQPATVAGIDMASVVREAWLATAQLSEDVTPETRESAFQLVLEAMLRDPAALGNGANGNDSQESTEDESDSGIEELYATPELRGDAISYYLNISRDCVEQLYSLGEEPALSVNRARLSKDDQVATKEIVLLMLAGRRAVGYDTTTAQIEGVLRQYMDSDDLKFNQTMDNAKEIVVLGSPQEEPRIVRLRSAGIDNVQQLSQKLVGS